MTTDRPRPTNRNARDAAAFIADVQKLAARDSGSAQHCNPAIDEMRRAIDEATTLVVLVRGVTVAGDPVWAFVLMTPSSHGAYLRAAPDGCNIDDYGTVVAHGAGPEPPPDVVARMRREHRYEPAP
jgi:hypothetical protein